MRSSHVGHLCCGPWDGALVGVESPRNRPRGHVVRSDVRLCCLGCRRRRTWRSAQRGARKLICRQERLMSNGAYKSRRPQGQRRSAPTKMKSRCRGCHDPTPLEPPVNRIGLLHTHLAAVVNRPGLLHGPARLEPRKTMSGSRGRSHGNWARNELRDHRRTHGSQSKRPRCRQLAHEDEQASE